MVLGFLWRFFSEPPTHPPTTQHYSLSSFALAFALSLSSMFWISTVFSREDQNNQVSFWSPPSLPPFFPRTTNNFLRGFLWVSTVFPPNTFFLGIGDSVFQTYFFCMDRRLGFLFAKPSGFPSVVGQIYFLHFFSVFGCVFLFSVLFRGRSSRLFNNDRPFILPLAFESRFFFWTVDKAPSRDGLP